MVPPLLGVTRYCVVEFVVLFAEVVVFGIII